MEAKKKENPTVDVRTVIKMFDDIKITIKETIEAEMKKQHVKYSGSVPQQDLERTVKLLQAKVDVCENRERMMINTMASLTDKVRELQEKSELNDINNTKRMFILSGFEASSKKHICRKQLDSFFTTELEVDVVIEDFYFIGRETTDKEQPRDIVIMLQSIQQRRIVFQNVSKIKTYVNSYEKNTISETSSQLSKMNSGKSANRRQTE